jgi:hypothetical protein
MALGDKRTGHVVGIVAAVLIAVPGYLLALQQHNTAEAESVRRIVAEDQKAQEVRARIAAEKKAEEAAARVAEIEAQAVEVTRRALAAQSSRVAEARVQTRDEIARRDATDLARLDTLRAQCAGVMSVPTPAPGLVGMTDATLKIKFCTPYYQALRERQLYEAARDGVAPPPETSPPAGQHSTGQYRMESTPKCNPNVRIC